MTASAGQPTEAAEILRAALARPHELDTLPETLSRVGDVIDELARGVLALDDAVAGSSAWATSVLTSTTCHRTRAP